jgi:hypothetical protein
MSFWAACAYAYSCQRRKVGAVQLHSILSRLLCHYMLCLRMVLTALLSLPSVKESANPGPRCSYCVLCKLHNPQAEGGEWLMSRIIIHDASQPHLGLASNVFSSEAIPLLNTLSSSLPTSSSIFRARSYIDHQQSDQLCVRIGQA